MRNPNNYRAHAIQGLLFIVLAMFGCGNVFGASATLTPVYVAYDGQITTNTVGGQTCWSDVSGFNDIYFQVPSSFTVTGNPVYVKFSYYDSGVGYIAMKYDGKDPDGTIDHYTVTEAHSRSSRVGTGAFVTSYQQLLKPVLAGGENGGADLRLELSAANGSGQLSIQANSVVIQDTPFTDPQFALALTKPWTNAYTGETRWDDVDASTLTGKVMCGYQGWFGAPNDPADKGWVHWVRNGIMDTNHFNTDMWPDMTEYPSTSWIQAANIKTKSGATAYVFSDSDEAAVETQFQWMRKYNIDGVFLQRFLNAVDPNEEWTLANVRQAAHAEGRVWVIEYDVSSLNDSTAFGQLTNDWGWMVNTFKILQDSRYGYQSGKPVVAIYGMGDTNKDANYNPSKGGITAATGQKIISWFKSNPYGSCYVWGGVPTSWLSEWSQESEVYTNYNAISTWHSANYAADIAKCATWGATYWPILWPGFSWSNEQQINANNSAFKDRNGGSFYWTKTYNAMTNPSVSSLFIGMFDEYDEGTAIMPMSDDPPKSPCGTYQGAFIDNEGMPSDWWMVLTAEAKADMYKQRTNSATMPPVTDSDVTNRSNIGPKVDDILTTNDVENRLYRVPVAYDGNTAVETVGGKSCRYNIYSTTNHYFYFNVDDNYAYKVTNGPDMDYSVEVEYYDAGGNVTFTLQYDGVNGAYTTHSKVITTAGTGQWRTARFEIADAYLGNDENDGADFRVYVTGTSKLDISHVWVRKEELKYSIWTLNDIGNVGAAGSGGIDEIFDQYTINGSGADIYGTSDSFAFCCQTNSGDSQIIALVSSVQNTATAAKAGVMMRASLATNAAEVSVVMTPGSGIKYLVRSTTGGTTAQTTVSGVTAPYWVKLTRTGNTFVSYCSPDSVTWTPIGTNTVTMPTSTFMGLAVTAKDVGVLNTSVFQYVSVTGDPFYDDGL